MNERHTRRRFLGAAAAGTTAIAVAAVSGGGAQRVANAADSADLARLTVPLVAYVRDAARGEVVFLVGTRELVRRDKRLASTLVAIAREERNDVVAS